MKLKQSSLDFFAFINIYRDQLENTFIKKIYQTGTNEFLFQIYRSDIKRKGLFVSLGKGMGFYEPERPDEATSIAMVLRKNLSERRIVSIEQINFDRVVRIRLHTGQEIIFELFREGNLIVINEGKIDYAINQREWKNRKIIRGEEYIPPSLKDPLSLSDEEFRDIITTSKATIVQTLATRLNLGGEASEELLYRIGLDKNTPAKESADRIPEMKSMLQSILEESKQNRAFYYSDETILSPVELKHLEKEPDRKFDDLNEGFSYYFQNYPKGGKEKSPLERRVDSQRRSIGEFRQLQQKYSEMGTKVMSNLQLFKKIVSDLSRRVKTENVDEIRDVFGIEVKKIDAGKKQAELLYQDGPLILDYTKSAGENANVLFSTSKEYRNKIEGAEVAIGESKRLMAVKPVKEKKKARPRQWFEVYHWFISSEGYLVISGRDTKTNEKVVKKHLKDNDLYVHAEVYGAPSTVIKVEDKEKPTEKTMGEAAAFAASFSRAWAAGMRTGSAYWVYPTQVSKTPEAGEFVSTGSWIVRGKRNYFFNVPLELEIGIVEYRNSSIPMICPPGILDPEKSKVVKIVPGGEKRNVVSRKIAEILGISNEEIERILPPGNSQIVQ